MIRAWLAATSAAVAVVAQVAGNFTVDPSSLDFGTVPVGSVSAAQSVTLSSTGPSGVVSSMAVTPSQSEFRPVGSCVDKTIGPESSCTMSFTFAPAAVGARRGTATYVVGGVTITVALSGAGSGTPATTTTTAAPATTVPATTSPPRTTTPPRTTASTARPPFTTAPPTTVLPNPSSSTTSTRPAASTTAPPGSTTTTTTTSPRRSEIGPPTLAVFTSAGTPIGPAGVGVTITGTGYVAGAELAAGADLALSGAAGSTCGTVYFHIDGVRIGSAQPDAAGHVRVTGLSIPGDSDAGRHTVTSSCRPSGTPQQASTGFVVTDASFHRAAFVTSLPHLGQVEITPASAVASLFAVAAVLLLIAFPAELFNSTLEENHEEIRRWFRLRPRPDEPRSATILFIAFVVLSGPLYFLINPKLHLDAGVLAGAFGLSVATGLVTLASDAPTVLFVRRQFREWGRLNVVPGSIWVALVCVLLSRAVRFQPGYFYGLIAGVAIGQRLRDDEGGWLAASSAGLLLILSVGSWVALGPVSHVAGRVTAPFWAVFLEAVLGGVFWVALDSLVIALMPLRFLQGSRITTWSRVAWAVLYGAVLLAFAHILLRPGSGYVADTRTSPAAVVVALFVGFALFSSGFWAYFRYRRPRPPAGLQAAADGLGQR